MLETSRTGCTVQEMLDETEVSDKTVRRDLKVLQTIFDISERTGDGGVKRWKMKPLSEQLEFNYTDLISIIMSRRFLEPLAGTPFWEGHHKVLQKVTGVLGDHAVEYCEKLNRFLQTSGFGVSDYTQRGRTIDRLILAMEERKRVLVVYQSMQSTEPVEQELGPQGFVWHNGSLYLIAWSSRSQEILNYKLDRIENVELGSELQYVVPDNFCLKEWQQSAFGVFHGGGTDRHRIRIHFTRDSARYVQESFWHASQQFFPQDDGSVIVELDINDFVPVIKWILSFGRNATVLEPSELVEEVNEELRQMLGVYSATRETAE